MLTKLSRVFVLGIRNLLIQDFTVGEKIMNPKKTFLSYDCTISLFAMAFTKGYLSIGEGVRFKQGRDELRLGEMLDLLNVHVISNELLLKTKF